MNNEEALRGKIIDAIKKNENSKINEYLKNGADPNLLYNNCSYIQLALYYKNIDAVKTLLSFGADPNIGVFKFLNDQTPFSALDIATGATHNIPALIEAAKLLIEYGATHGGILSIGLSRKQKKELDKEREKYIEIGKEKVKFLKENLNVKENFQPEDFFNDIKCEQYIEKYNSLEPKYKALINNDIKTIYEKISNNPNWLKHFFKSYGGALYIEPSPQKEIHSALFHLELILESHSQLVINQLVSYEKNDLLNITEPITLSGLDMDINSPFE